MLLQLQHEHKAIQSSPVSAKLSPFTKPKASKKKKSIQQSQQNSIEEQTPVVSLASYLHLQGLENVYKQSLKQLSPLMITGISKRKTLSQERIYSATVNNANDFISIHLRDCKPRLKCQLQSLLEGIHTEVEAGIWDGKYQIDQNRNKYSVKGDKEKELVSFITNELVMRNLESCVEDLNEYDEEGEQCINVLVSSHAKTEIYKTKKAEQFVNRMREKQAKVIEDLTKKLEQQKIKEQINRQQQKNQQQLHRKQKKQLIRRRIQKQNEFMAIEKQRKQKINNDYQKMISSYKKPLYRDIQQRYNKSVLQQQKKKFHLLQDIKDNSIINFDQINEHMVKYSELLSEDEQLRQQKRQLRESQQEVFASKRPRRSKFHSLVLRGSPKIDQNQFKVSLIRRQNDYADYVKHNFVPRIDDKKKQEITNLIKRISQQKSNSYSRRHMSHGKRNLEQLHIMIEQLRAKNLIKPNLEFQAINMPKQVSNKYKNYLEQLKKSKQKSQSEKFLNIQSIKNKDDDHLRLISKQKQEKAKQKQHYLNSSIENIDIQAHMEGNIIVQQNYIDATRAKMALLKKYQKISPQPLDIQKQP